LIKNYEKVVASTFFLNVPVKVTQVPEIKLPYPTKVPQIYKYLLEQKYLASSGDRVLDLQSKDVSGKSRDRMLKRVS
jgi:hypothetical protein